MFTLKHLGTSVLGMTLAASAYADAQQVSGKNEEAAAQPAAQSAMRAYVDPETGRLVDRPVTPEQKRAAADALAPNTAKVTKIQHANGMREYDLNGRADEALVATVRPDGSLEYRCVGHDVPVGQPHALKPEVRDDR
ncbi:hypothetical protein [Dokdonella sp.]|uniref:post-PEP-CTERM-1 domain-containing protein n=1 Tax=Dokdonella sp. TaxID=2291710 RepID=UPI001B279FEA|nr:hypothetical protein [Dokdonella sp.]MBO9663503.1 hypothetical protein [Dokdonella sp.]